MIFDFRTLRPMRFFTAKPVARPEIVATAADTPSAELDVKWCRKWIDQRRQLVFTCSELTAKELSMWGCMLEELEKDMYAAVEDRRRLRDHQLRQLDQGVNACPV